MKAKKDVAGGNYSRSGRVACLPKANASHSETSSAATTSLAEMSPSQAGAAQLRQQAAAGGACYMKTTADLASKKTGVKVRNEQHTFRFHTLISAYACRDRPHASLRVPPHSQLSP
eukprot:SAG31_NODE_1960_length_6804_cov_3.421626_5_plen_116_part_00